MKKIIFASFFVLLLAGCSNKTVDDISSSLTQESSSSQVISSAQSSDISKGTSSEKSNGESESSEAIYSSSSNNNEKADVSSSANTSKDESQTTEPKTEAPNPAKKNWALAYDSFYCGMKDVKSSEIEMINIPDLKLQIRNELIFPIYTAKNFNDIYLIDSNNQKPVEVFYGAVVEMADGSYYGEGIIKGKKINQVSNFPVGMYDSRLSMTITEGIEGQLEKAGFTPETTKAYALTVEEIVSGIVFENDSNKLFYVQGPAIYGTYLEYGTMMDFCTFTTQCEQIYNDMAKEKIANNNPSIPAPEKPDASIVNPDTGKPVIYLYPEKETDVKVRLDYKGEFTYTYPKYNNGWNVKAYPDGKLINNEDKSEHYYLFWEGNEKFDWDFTNGFLVKGTDTEVFLKDKLTLLGLTPKEYNDFITYWAPEMSKNDKNLITFSYDQYEELAPLHIEPKPDTVLRVHMVYKKYEGEDIPMPQTLIKTERKGFTIVEWGGTRA